MPRHIPGTPWSAENYAAPLTILSPHCVIAAVTGGIIRESANPAENKIRPFVVGTRSWLFADSVGGPKASENLYSLVQTCVANRIDAYRYPVDLFTSLPCANTADSYEALLRRNLGKPEQDVSAKSIPV